MFRRIKQEGERERNPQKSDTQWNSLCQISNNFSVKLIKQQCQFFFFLYLLFTLPHFQCEYVPPFWYIKQ